MKKRFNVLVTRRLHKSALDELEKKCNVFLHNGKIPIPKKNLINKIKDMDGLICHPYDTIDKKVIKSAKNLKVISTFSVGFDHIDIDFSKSLGIKIGYTPEVLTNATAELTIGLILDILRRISEGDRIIRNKKWNVIFGAYDYTGTEVSGKTIGIIGMGRIGREVAKKANGLGMNVIYHNRKPVSKSIERKLKAKYVSESVLYKKSDVISLHVPYNKDTHHLMNSKIFKKMKKTSFLINTSRGKIVNEKQLVTALKTKEIQGAGMDVYESEPVHRDSLLLKLENVVLAPHVGSSTNETRLKMSDITVKNLVFALEGKKLLYSV
jgi:glyoxylate reductase